MGLFQGHQNLVLKAVVMYHGLTFPKGFYSASYNEIWEELRKLGGKGR